MHEHTHDGALSRWLEETLESLGAGHQITEFIQHLVMDALEIFLLMFTVLFIVSLLGTFVDFHKLEHRLSHVKGPLAYLLAVVLGTLSPFCSCSVVPLVMGMLSVGVPLGVSTAFLLGASLLNLSSLVVMPAVLGSLTGAYLFFAAVIILIVSFIFSKADASGYVKESYLPHAHSHPDHSSSWGGRILSALRSTGHTMGQVWYWVLAGVTISAALAAFLPYETLYRLVNQNLLLSLPLSGLIGLLLHSDIFSALPILRILLETNAAAAMAYLLAVMSVSFAQVVLMVQVFRKRFILTYAALLYLLSLAAGTAILLF